MAKLKLNPAPTFQASVGIPVAGGEPVDVVMTFRHRTRSQLDEFMSARVSKSDTESFMDMVIGWDLDDEFNAENVTRLLENYIGAPLATFHTYIDELCKARVKN